MLAYETHCYAEGRQAAMQTECDLKSAAAQHHSLTLLQSRARSEQGQLVPMIFIGTALHDAASPPWSNDRRFSKGPAAAQTQNLDAWHLPPNAA